MKIPLSGFRSCLKAAIAGDLIAQLDKDLPDFSETEPHSAARGKLAPIKGARHQQTRSRASLERELKKQPAIESKLKEETGTSKSEHIQTVVNRLMQSQLTERDIPWVPNKEYDSSNVAAQACPVIHKPFDLCSKVQWHEYDARLAAMSIAIEDSCACEG